MALLKLVFIEKITIRTKKVQNQTLIFVLKQNFIEVYSIINLFIPPIVQSFMKI